LWLRGKRDPVLWDLACDIAVENVIDSLHRKSVERPLTYVRRRAYEGITTEGKVVAAAPAYRWLLTQSVGVQKQLAREFYADDHRLWPKDQQNPQNSPTPSPQKTWQKIGQRMQTELELRDKEAGDGAEALQTQVRAANRSRRSYRDFLRRFCVLREEVHLDPDSFDLNFYTYGLSLYGNLPLIEPNETRESKKIEELALVVDTSYSTSGELVRAFLSETYALLKQRENFFHRMVLHIIQADNTVQKDDLITNEAELIRVMNNFELKGGGGTDFRPAFAYVTRLCDEKKFQNLRGLLYFTDGLGTYPTKRPPYETAFLFLGDRFDDANVPPWAMKVVLEEEEFLPPPTPRTDTADEDFDAYRDLNNL
jgi:predicted metal-dependent peptidase